MIDTAKLNTEELGNIIVDVPERDRLLVRCG